MTDGTLLLAAILAQPDEDTPRLVYADWLQENGQGERAEFIRVQVEYARIHAHVAAHNDDACETCRRGFYLSDLLTTKFRVPRSAPAPFATDDPWHLLGLETDYIGPRREWDWYRGFVEAVRFSAADWLKFADAILAAHPVREVMMTTWPNYFYYDDARGRGRWVDTGDPHWHAEPEIARRVFETKAAYRWPRIVFTLPLTASDVADEAMG